MVDPIGEMSVKILDRRRDVFRRIGRAQWVVASGTVLGSGENHAVTDVVYVRPAAFEAKHTQVIAADVEALNRKLVSGNQLHVLIGLGR